MGIVSGPPISPQTTRSHSASEIFPDKDQQQQQPQLIPPPPLPHQSNISPSTPPVHTFNLQPFPNTAHHLSSTFSHAPQSGFKPASHEMDWYGKPTTMLAAPPVPQGAFAPHPSIMSKISGNYSTSSSLLFQNSYNPLAFPTQVPRIPTQDMFMQNTTTLLPSPATLQGNHHNTNNSMSYSTFFNFLPNTAPHMTPPKSSNVSLGFNPQLFNEIDSGMMQLSNSMYNSTTQSQLAYSPNTEPPGQTSNRQGVSQTNNPTANMVFPQAFQNLPSHSLLHTNTAQQFTSELTSHDFAQGSLLLPPQFNPMQEEQDQQTLDLLKDNTSANAIEDHFDFNVAPTLNMQSAVFAVDDFTKRHAPSPLEDKK